LIFPCVNPDGRHYSQTSHPLWRHNRNPSESGGNPNCVGVDINRNYDFLWDYHKFFSPKSKVNTSSNPCDQDQTYMGSAPFSEPETQNVKWLFDNYPMIKWYVDIHSYGEDILHSWGDDENQSDNPSMNFVNPLYNSKRGVEDDESYKEYVPNADLSIAVALANSIRDGIEAVRGKRYAVKSGFHLYPTSGASDDYSYSRHFSNPSNNKILAFTLEWGEKNESSAEASFHPKWEEMKKIVIDVTAGLLKSCSAIARNSL
jgi:murein tripeptide amidase MpaA